MPKGFIQNKKPTYIEYHNDNHTFEAYITYPSSNHDEKLPAVLVFHAWAGRDEFSCKKADELAKLGYIGVAMDLYGKGITGKNEEENSKLMTPLVQNRTLLRSRILAGFDSICKNNWIDANRLGAIGFCFGGLCALDLARSGANIRGVVSFHGLLNPPTNLETKTINSKLLILHGHEDPLVTTESVQAFQQEMTHSKVDWQFHTFGNTKHAFTNPDANNPDHGLIYNKLADRRSWLLMKDFFKELF